MRIHDLLTEAKFVGTFDDPYTRDRPSIYMNPSKLDLSRALGRRDVTRGHDEIVRGILDGDDLYYWQKEDVIHIQVYRTDFGKTLGRHTLPVILRRTKPYIAASAVGHGTNDNPPDSMPAMVVNHPVIKRLYGDLDAADIEIHYL